MRYFLFALAVIMTVVAVAVFVRGIRALFRQIRVGAPSPGRLTPLPGRLRLLVTEVLSHRQFQSRPVVRIAHWFVMMSFILLVPTLAGAYVQILNPHGGLPVIGHWAAWQWLIEFFSWTGLVGIIALIVIRMRFSSDPERADLARDWRSRFFGSTRWQAWFVEAVIALVICCVLGLHALESALLRLDPQTYALGSWPHYPTTRWLGDLLSTGSAGPLEAGISALALAKVVISMTWMAVVGASTTMGVAWHRFLSVLNVYAQRELDGSPALGPLTPMLVDGKAFDIREIEELDEDATFGVSTITDFGWKALLDFATCSECGRCQDVCPAWNTGKPLSPKLFTLALRDHANAVTAGLVPAQLGPELAPGETADVRTALISSGATGADGVRLTPGELVPGVISPEVLWSCTTCGACVQQCPVDIEHVDHILDLRRSEVMTRSAFPAEFGSLFQRLETKGNPWGLAPRARTEWMKGLDFEIPVLGRDLADLSGTDYLFFVGCAGAYDEKGIRTTRAVAELLHTAGVSFAVLGEAESCTGDSARRAGNEATYQMMALANIETFAEYGVQRIIVSCAHCLNTLAREYPDLGGHYRVEHYATVLNRLVREGRLVLAPPAAGEGAEITYHDPCYLGRHNGEYDTPRALLELTGQSLVEMAHSGPTSMCCGAGGARMWTEETIGTRINEARMAEATATGAELVATACPFCTVMLSDAAAASDQAPAVTDVAQLVLASVHRAQQVDA